MRAALLAGALVGISLWLLIWALLPARADLNSAMALLSGQATEPTHGHDLGQLDMRLRVGRWLERRFYGSPLLPIPVKDLRLLRVEPAHYLGEKALMFLLGLSVPPLLTAMAHVVGLSIPLALPGAATLGFAAVFWFLPDLALRDRAKKARLEFARAAATYTDILALERLAQSNAVQAMERGVQRGDTWPFRMMHDPIVLARYAGEQPWTRLQRLGEEIGVHEVSELADIMKLAGGSGSSVVNNLRARARGTRSALLAKEKTAANEASERLAVPVGCTLLVLVCLLATPAATQIM